MKKRRAHVWISGRVQGVFFRAYTGEAAHRIGVTGWVRNLVDGRVEAVFEGEADKVEKMIDWCWEGSPFSRVEKVEVVEEVYSGDFDRLVITH
jgi:acylphosphatase